MSLITHIDKVPLFTTIAEAELWAEQYGLTGYHEHEVLGQLGYMGGNNHIEIQIAMIGGVVNIVSAQQMKTAAAGITSTNGGGTTTGGNGGNGGASGSNGEGATERPSEQESGGETSGEGDSGGGRSRGGGATEGGGY
tara:strand:- start:279 stop:692 length:414 start_codon:yes stop_codon:yes gene_type:complete